MKYGLAALGLLLAAFALLFFLKAEAQTPGVTLLWTVPQNTSPGASYLMRYSRTAVGADTLAWWNGANVVGGVPVPGPIGSTDSVYVPLGSWAQTYYFIVRTCNAPFCATWSNVDAYTTPAGPPGRISDLRHR